MSFQDLSGKTAVCVGASQGIGAGVAVEFARRNASVIIVARQESLMKQVVKELRTASKSDEGKILDYIKADLSTIAGMKDAVKQITSKTGTRGVDYLIQTQGALPNGKLDITSDGLDSTFAVMLSRFALPYLLAKQGVLKGGLINICAPGGGTDVDVDDLDLQKLAKAGMYGRGLKDLLIAAKRGMSFLDAITLEFPTHFPAISAAHLFPGHVVTNILANSKFPFPLPLIVSLINTPMVYLGLRTTPKAFAHVPADLAASGKSGLFKETLMEEAPSEWATVDANRKALWVKLESMLE